MAVAAFTVSALRQEVIDFTIPYIDLGLTVLMKKRQSEKGLLAFMDPFTNDVWFLLFCSTMYVGVLLTICSKLSPYGFYGQVVQADENVLGKFRPSRPHPLKPQILSPQKVTRNNFEIWTQTVKP